MAERGCIFRRRSVGAGVLLASVTQTEPEKTARAGLRLLFRICRSAVQPTSCRDVFYCEGLCERSQPSLFNGGGLQMTGMILLLGGWVMTGHVPVFCSSAGSALADSVAASTLVRSARDLDGVAAPIVSGCPAPISGGFRFADSGFVRDIEVFGASCFVVLRLLFSFALVAWQQEWASREGAGEG